MKYTYAYKTSDGVRHEDSMNAESRDEVFAELRKRGEELLDFLHLYVAKDIMTEFLGAAKKLMFRFGESQSCSKFKFEQVKRTNEIRDLEQSISRWLHVLDELDCAVDASFENLMEHSCNRSLSTIVVYLYATERFKEEFVDKNEIFQRDFQSVYDLINRVDEFFVDAQAMVIEVHLSGESHHSRKYTSAQLTAEHGVVLFAANKRSGMEAMAFKTYFTVGVFEFGDFRGNIYRLIVKHHANNIKPRFSIGKTEVTRFVHENAQCFGLHGNVLKKREWRDANPATHAESFPRIPVTPSLGKKSSRIISNRRYSSKWHESSNRNRNRRAA